MKHLFITQEYSLSDLGGKLRSSYKKDRVQFLSFLDRYKYANLEKIHTRYNIKLLRLKRKNSNKSEYDKLWDWYRHSLIKLRVKLDNIKSEYYKRKLSSMIERGKIDKEKANNLYKKQKKQLIKGKNDFKHALDKMEKSELNPYKDIEKAIVKSPDITQDIEDEVSSEINNVQEIPTIGDV